MSVRRSGKSSLWQKGSTLAVIFGSWVGVIDSLGPGIQRSCIYGCRCREPLSIHWKTRRETVGYLLNSPEIQLRVRSNWESKSYVNTSNTCSFFMPGCPSNNLVGGMNLVNWRKELAEGLNWIIVSKGSDKQVITSGWHVSNEYGIRRLPKLLYYKSRCTLKW